MHEASLVRSGMASDEIVAAAVSLFEGERDAIANLANLAALVFHSVPRLNWAGSYLVRGGELVVGPFQGKPACVRIALGKGVCGAAAASRATMIVDDVLTFPDHIACDADSRSEIVVPLLLGDRLLGVLDLDSPEPARFGPGERALLERLAEMVVRASEWT